MADDNPDVLSELYQRDLQSHLLAYFGPRANERIWSHGPSLPGECRISLHPPTSTTGCWIYATCGMTEFAEDALTEIFLMSPRESEDHIELLTAIAHYHQTGAPLGPEHTINFGRPWLPQSSCNFGLLTHPYTFSPELEHARLTGRDVQVLWLLPITEDEREYNLANGLAALETLFEQKQVNYLDPLRASVIEPGT